MRKKPEPHLSYGVYLTERQIKKRKRRFKLRIYGGLFLLPVALAGAFYLVAYSPVFRIKNIVVREINAAIQSENPDSKKSLEGNLVQDLKYFYASRSDIAAFLGPDNILVWNSKSLPSSSIFWNVYSKIANLQVKRNYLKREIEIDYQTRNRFGIWCRVVQTATDTALTYTQGYSNQSMSAPTESASSSQEFASCFWFDDAGVVFQPAPDVTGNLIYRVDDLSNRSLPLGNSVLEPRLLANLFKIFDFLGKTDFQAAPLELKDLAFEEVETEPASSSTPKIYFSLRFDPAFALKALVSIKKADLEKAGYIDLRVENRIYYK